MKHYPYSLDDPLSVRPDPMDGLDQPSPGGEASECLRSMIKALVRDVPGFPSPGVLFKDITPVLADAVAFRLAVEELAAPYKGQVDKVAAIEARGFVFGAPIAALLGAGFVPMRKAGKLPGPSLSQRYFLEYSDATLEVHLGSLMPGERVLVVDDVIATGGTARAAIELVSQSGAHVVAVAALLEIASLKGRECIGAHAMRSLIVV